MNLASAEYFKVIDKKLLKAEIINVEFKEEKDGKLKSIAIYAKRARGKLANHIITEAIVDPEQIKLYERDGYCYNEKMSDKNNYVFIR